VFFFGDFEFGGVSSRGKSTSITVDNVCYHTCSSLRNLHKTNNIYVHHFNQWRRNEFESVGGGTGLARKWEPLIRRNLVVPLDVLALKAQLVVLVSAFVMVSTVRSVSCLLFFYLRCPRFQPFVKVGGTCPPAPWSRRHSF